MQVIFSNRAYMAVISETIEKIKTETGGIFLGCYENGNWYVVEAIDPGPKSVFQVAYFEYDKKYTEHLINKIARMYQS
jgi:phage terminase large subunit